jgi:hypothetical protein
MNMKFKEFVAEETASSVFIVAAIFRDCIAL